MNHRFMSDDLRSAISPSSFGGYMFSGVRPSSGAATYILIKRSNHCRHLLLSVIAAPEDGRTPLNTGALPPTIQQSNNPTIHRCSAFTLIEIMVAVALMSLIVLGLLAMFNQTQRAFRASGTPGPKETGRHR